MRPYCICRCSFCFIVARIIDKNIIDISILVSIVLTKVNAIIIGQSTCINYHLLRILVHIVIIVFTIITYCLGQSIRSNHVKFWIKFSCRSVVKIIACRTGRTIFGISILIQKLGKSFFWRINGK